MLSRGSGATFSIYTCIAQETFCEFVCVINVTIIIIIIIILTCDPLKGLKKTHALIALVALI
jgi:hypothetical protein